MPEDEDPSWEEFKQDTTPMTHSMHHHQEKGFQTIRQYIRHIDQQREHEIKDTTFLHSPTPSFQVELGSTRWIDGATAKKIKTGNYPIDCTLDLHGMTQEEAFQQLVATIHKAQNNHQRCLRVVTGKGRAGKGIIKQSIQRWLNSPMLQSSILFFCQATINDGGSGAYYVLLRKNN